MLSFLARRFLAAVITLYCIATISFFITRLAPGSPFSQKGKISDEAIENLRSYYGLDRPIWKQYLSTMWNYTQGDFGPSYYNRNKSVQEIIGPALRKSMILGGLAFFLAILVGVPLGVLAAQHKNQPPDHITMSVSVAGICIPNFLLGPLLVMVFGFWFDLLPVAGWPEQFTFAELQKLILPVITLSMIHIAYIARLTRSGMLDTIKKDFIRTARAKGVSERSVIWKHTLKNGMSPVISYLGPMAAMIVTGSVVVEEIFALPGLGRHFVRSALSRDHPLLMGSVLVFSTLIIVFNLLVDIAYSLLDPRIEAQ